MSGYEVHWPTLAEAGGNAGKTASELTETKSSLTGATPRAIATHAGWESATALQTCLTAWETRLSDITYEVETIGQNLGASAQQYQKAEADTTALLERLAAQLNGSPGR